jgi:hypothetical protein
MKAFNNEPGINHALFNEPTFMIIHQTKQVLKDTKDIARGDSN